MKEEINDWLKSNEFAEYCELLKFESVGVRRDRLKDCAACATWLKKWLEKTGAEARLLTHDFAPPVLFAEIKGSPDRPCVLFYGHYDVQPPEPLDEWQSPPFEPDVREGRVYARGAQDNKGQFFAFLCGLKEYIAAHGERDRPTVKIVIEGQEESGSAALAALAPGLREKLAADVMLVCDSAAAPGLRPSIEAGLRGVNHFTVNLAAASRDLHSGEYGGIAPNAAQGMAALVASLHAPDGSIAVDGFCAGIEPPSEEEKRLAASGAPSAGEYEADIGCKPCGGERARSLVERNSFEPTIEVNGIHSGYGGAGSKTVIPCVATAKISTRLVPGQNPKAAFEAVKRHLEEHCPEGMKLEITETSGFASGFRLPLASPLFRLAEDVLKEMDARGAVFHWNGASIPIVSTLREISGAAPLLVGWGQSEDRIHSPNESYSFVQFAKAKEWAGRILEAL